MTIVEMTMSDYDEVLALWSVAEGVTLRDVDSREHIAAYLRRNPGTCFIAREDERLLGAVLCGHDGRRGYLHHLAIVSDQRRRGIGTQLVERCMAGLQAEGIFTCHLFVRAGNSSGQAFWKMSGWAERMDIVMMTRTLAAGESL